MYMQLENKYGNINLKIHEHETKVLNCNSKFLHYRNLVNNLFFDFLIFINLAITNY